MKRLTEKYKLLLIGISIGVVYGLFTRLIFDEKATLASITYLFLIPTILGMIPLIFANDVQLRSYRNIIFIPWICVATFFLTMFLLGIEEIICLLILGGPFFILGTLGGLLFRFIQLRQQNKKRNLMTFLLLPFIFAPVEEFIKTPSEEYSVISEVTVNAEPSLIWEQIIQVPRIAESEYNAGIFNTLGIPRPIEASITNENVGGLRIGKFEGGLEFTERIKEWKPYRRVSFDIHIDPETVRPNVFDQHVLNGNYFTFVDASYELYQRNDGVTNLRLISKYRLTSKVNFYGKIWGEWILSDFQDRLLVVIKNRCEK